MKKKSGKYWLDSEEKRLLYNLKNPEKYKKYKKKIKDEDIEKGSEENLEKESKENEESHISQVQTGIITCYQCGKRCISSESPDNLPHRYCKNCVQTEEYKMQQNLSRLPIEIRRRFEPYIRKGIIGWYDTSPEDRELHDREMESNRKGTILVSEASKDDVETNQEYLKKTIGFGEEEAQDIINHLDLNRINLVHRQKNWNTLLRSLKEEGVQIKKTKIKEPLAIFIPALDNYIRERERDAYVKLHIKTRDSVPPDVV